MANSEVLLWENPDMLDNPWYGNPRRRRRRSRRNPGALAMPKGVQDLTQGVGAQEILGGGLGLVGAAAIPRMVIAPGKADSGEALTMQEKLMRVGIGVLATLGVGFVAQNVAGKGAAKAAVIGGLAGVAVTAVNTFTPMKLGTPGNQGAIGGRVSMSPVARTVSRGVGTQTPGFETMKLY